MPRVYLSPSLQEYNLYVNGGTEEEITNLIADAMEPYLLASGIEFTRNRPEMSLGEAIAASNAGNYDLHFAIHSNAAPESLAGKLQGVDAYYFYNSPYGREMADIVTENMKQVYPDGEKSAVCGNGNTAGIAPYQCAGSIGGSRVSRQCGGCPVDQREY